ncbi:hypothetical protein ACHAPE_002400 [Trichoderma viride]
MHPVAIAFDVLPQVRNAIVVYKTVRSKFKIFRHYSSEIDRIRKLFSAQRGCFLNEVELLLRLVIDDPSIIDDMMKNPVNGQWDGYASGMNVKAVFGRNLSLLRDVVDDIAASIAALQNAFQCFLPLEQEQERDEDLKSKPLKDAMRKLRKRVQVTIEKTNFESKIARLEKLNNELVRLRQQVNELQAPSCCAIRRSSDRARKLPAEFGAYGSIRRASKALHEGLTATWAEAEVPSLRHLVKLFLDAKADTEVQMEIAILCYDDVLQQRPLVETGLTRVQVRSRTMGSIAWSGARLLLPPPTIDEAQRGQRKRQKVKFASISDNSEIASEASPAASAVLDIVSQLQLAHRLVSAVLKFNSTPWLKELWNVGDLAFFRQGDDLAESLQTLHFGVELTHNAPGSEDTAMELESPASLVHLSIEDAQYKHGVRNATLYSLGAALLAIGRWECVDHNDIEGIRRLASQRSYLGPVYQELTQKVLDCDFGFGKDLKKPRLQEAIYEMVIVELESMIASLDISRD